LWLSRSVEAAGVAATVKAGAMATTMSAKRAHVREIRARLVRVSDA
jgi:hypothetical protein